MLIEQLFPNLAPSGHRVASLANWRAIGGLLPEKSGQALPGIAACRAAPANAGLLPVDNGPQKPDNAKGCHRVHLWPPLASGLPSTNGF